MNKLKKKASVRLLENYYYAEVASCGIYLKAGTIGTVLWVGDDRSRVKFAEIIFSIVPNSLLELVSNE